MVTALRRHSRLYAAVVIVLFAATLFLVLDSRTRALVLNSFRLAALTCIVVVPLGLLLATLLTKFALPGKRLAWILLVSGLFLPLYLVATAWQAALGLQGWATQLVPTVGSAGPILSGWTGAVFTHAVALLPVTTLLIAAGLASVERELEEDALLAARPLVVLVRVTWRRSLGAILAAVVWVFVVCVGEMTVTDLFQIRTFAEEIYVQTAGGAIWDLAGVPGLAPLADGLSRGSFVAGTLMLLLILILAVWQCLSVVRRWHRVGIRRPWVVELKQGGRGLAAMITLLLVATIVIPLGSLLYQAGIYVEGQGGAFVAHWSLGKALTEAARAPSLHRSELTATAIVASAAATAATLIAGLFGVWSVSRRVPPGSGKVAAAASAAILAAIPGPLLGLWIIRVLNQPPDSPLSFLAVLYDEAAFGFAPWLAQTLRVFPFAVMILVPALSRTPRALLDAAALDGAALWRKVVHVFMPLHWRAVAVAWLVAFVLAAGELSATVLVAPPGVTPLAVRIFNLVHYGVDDQLAGLVLFVWAMVIVITAAVFVLAGRIGRPKV
jgi:iron(III) transport system permease protein